MLQAVITIPRREGWGGYTMVEISLHMYTDHPLYENYTKP